MDPNLVPLLVASGATLLGIVVTAIIWNLAKIRTVVWWLGLSLVPLGVYLLGLTPQVIGAYDTLRAWYHDLEYTPLVWVGVAMAGLGAVLMLVSRVIPARPRKKPDAAASARPVAARPAAAPAAMPAQRTSTSQPTPADADLDEVTEILRRRGID